MADSLALRTPTLTPVPRWGFHLMGTCRMGRDPRTSVVTADLRVHGVENVYLSGASVFVTSGTANPTLTIAALTLRLADHLLAA
jgi:choline dehydrogenase-like flavoprotein